MDDELPGGVWHIDAETHAALRLDRVRQALERGAYTTAVVEAEELLDEDPAHPDALFLLGEALLEIGHAELAVEVYRQHNELTRGTQPASLLGLAVASFEVCALSESIGAAREAVRLAPDLAEAHYTMGLALEVLGRNAEALTAFSAAQQLDPVAFPFPIQQDLDAWQDEIEAAMEGVEPDVRAFWSGVPVVLMDAPDLEELRTHEPAIPPTVTGLYQGDPPGEDVDPATRRPAALRLFTRNLARNTDRAERIARIADCLVDEALDWFGLARDPDEAPPE